MENLCSDQLVDLAIDFQIQRERKGESEFEDGPFFIADLGQVARQHRRWKLDLPNVQPFYAVKCNCDPVLLRVLAELGTGFDCASIPEMRSILELGVHPSRIVLANPCKAAQVLVYARKAGVKTTVFDNLDELETISRYMPEAQLLLRIHANDDTALIKFGEKFGAPASVSCALLKRAQELGLNVAGVSFHVGTGANDLNAFRKAISEASAVFETAREMGFAMRVLDVGGGFQDENFSAIAATIRQEIAHGIPSTTKIIAEPGRFYARSVYTLVCRVISRRRQTIDTGKIQSDMLYQNDGLYGHFMNRIMEKEIYRPVLVPDASKGEREVGPHRYTVWGPTCDGGDFVVRDAVLPSEVKIGDWLKYKDMGAYTGTTATKFNGFSSDCRTLYIDSEQLRLELKVQAV